MYKRTKFLFLVILSLLLSACGPDEIQVPVERSTHYVEGPFSYVGNIESEHVDLFSYLRDDGKFCLTIVSYSSLRSPSSVRSSFADNPRTNPLSFDYDT